MGGETKPRSLKLMLSSTYNRTRRTTVAVAAVGLTFLALIFVAANKGNTKQILYEQYSNFITNDEDISQQQQFDPFELVNFSTISVTADDLLNFRGSVEDDDQDDEHAGHDDEDEYSHLDYSLDKEDNELQNNVFTEEDVMETEFVPARPTFAEGDTNISSLLPLPARIVPQNPNTLVNYRTTKCTYFCQLALAEGYALNRAAAISPHRTPPEMLIISYKRYLQFNSLKKTIINQIGRGSSCIGGGKGRQLACRTELAAADGCDFDDLHIQPPQWNIQKPAACREFFTRAAMYPKGTIFIAKPGGSFHGKGITIHDDLNVMKKRFGNCERVMAEGIIVQEYISSPALMSGHKFDFRSYLLIASTDPMIVFYHDGFVRKASGVYSTDSNDLKDPLKQVTNDVHQQEEDHFFSFEQLEESLVREYGPSKGFSKGVLKNKFVKHAMRVTNFLFHSSWKNSKGLLPTPGRFQVFALDWMVDGEANFHLLEGNGNPLVTHYPGTGLTPGLWSSLIRLEKYLHTDPNNLLEGSFDRLSVEDGFHYEGWRLVFNQLEAEEAGEEYNSCKFHEYIETKHPLYSFDNLNI